MSQSTISAAVASLMQPGEISRSAMTLLIPSPCGPLPRPTTYRAKLRRAKVRRKNRIAARALRIGWAL